VNGRVALVTGAGRGIGHATVQTLVERGVRVMGVARTQRELDDLARETGAEVVAESIATPEGCRRVVEETERRLGPVEILVNNAGYGSAGGAPVWDLDPERWRESFAVNLHAPFELTRLAAPGMVERRWGRVINVSSTAGEVGAPAMADYCASKAGLLGLTRAAAQDLGRFDVTCNAVLPGWVRTEMADRKALQEAEQRGLSLDEIWAERAASYPAGRVLEPDEVAHLIAYLASDEASGVNGETITIALGSVW